MTRIKNNDRAPRMETGTLQLGRGPDCQSIARPPTSPMKPQSREDTIISLVSSSLKFKPQYFTKPLFNKLIKIVMTIPPAIPSQLALR
jgi:hypothetical protein